MSSTDFRGYLNPAKNDDESSNQSIIYESSESVVFESSSANSFGTDAFLADPALSEGDGDAESEARSAVNIEPEHHDYGNRF